MLQVKTTDAERHGQCSLTLEHTLDLIPSGPSGEPNEAVLARFIENIPSQLEITIGGDTQNYKQYMSNLIGMRNSGFWSNYKG